MMYHTGLHLECENEACKVQATFDNPAGQSDHVLEAKAMLAQKPYRVGWYLPVYGGKRLCPKDHQALADKLGWESLYEKPAPKGIPVEKAEASKSAKKTASSKEGAD